MVGGESVNSELGNDGGEGGRERREGRTGGRKEMKFRKKEGKGSGQKKQKRKVLWGRRRVFIVCNRVLKAW
jgi:hypothetical protein